MNKNVVRVHTGNLKNVRGITLIALVVTIIVLLILAGVSITTLTGENGILNRAKVAGEKNLEAEEDENNKLSSYEIEIDKSISQISQRDEPSNIIGIKRRWKEGKNWYTIYSDGWVEQGGVINSSEAIKTVNLFIQFSDADYNITATSSYRIDDETLYQPHVSDINNNSFKISSFGERGSSTYSWGAPLYWSAKGYGDRDAITRILEQDE